MSRVAVVAAALLIGLTSPVTAQSTADILAGLRNGGGWAAVPIDDGLGSMSTGSLPTMGMTVAGCLNVWPGHSGTFEITAHETVADTTLALVAEPGRGIPFTHTFGRQAQVDFVVRWSEPRDTTLLLWIGVAVGRTPEEACEPVYGGGGR